MVEVMSRSKGQNRRGMLNDVTVMVLTFNEAPNIERTLEKLSWAKEILVVDSFSTDETLAIAKRHSQARVIQRQFDSFAAQCNFGLQQIKTEWVLSLDADYMLPDEFKREMEQLSSSDDVAGYSARFIYCIRGRPLRASLYPPRTVLYRKNRARYHPESRAFCGSKDLNRNIEDPKKCLRIKPAATPCA